MMTHRFPADSYAAQLSAVGAQETRVIILETASGQIQKGDEIDFGPKATELEFKPAQRFQVARIVPGTKGNGVLPGFAIVEVCAPPGAMIEGPKEKKAAKST